MRRLLRWTILLCLLVTLLVVGLLWLGRGQPVSARADALHLTDCRLPCWISIVPGRTRLSEAQGLILSLFPHDLPDNNLLSRVAWTIRVKEGDFTVYLIAPPDTSGHLSDPNPVIDGIVLEPALGDGSLNVATAINLLGEPTGVGVSALADSRYMFTSLYFSGVAMNIATGESRACGAITPGATIQSLLISTAAPLRGLSQSWQGFRSCYRAMRWGRE